MKRVFVILIVLASLTGCDARTHTGDFAVRKESPVVNIPVALRQRNWIGSQGEGSCVWASTISLLRWQGRYRAANWIRKNYGNGEWPDDWAAKMDKIGLRYAMTTAGDVEFLEWSIRTRRGAAVTIMGGAHCVNLVFLDDKWACLLDNNDVQHYRWVPRETFLAEWAASYGWGLTVVYSPAPPLPTP